MKLENPMTTPATPKTPNGFHVIPPGSTLLTSFQEEGITIVCWKDAKRVMAHLANFLNAVESIKEVGWDGGYSHRLIRGSSTQWSEHSAGTALDWNASQHARGGARYGGFTKTQVDVIRWYLSTEVGKMWKWGADFQTTPDPMHFELRSKATWDAAKADGKWWTK